MSVHPARFEGRLGVMRGMPATADLADLWLVHAVTHLLEACDVPEADRQKLLESGKDAFEPGLHARSSAATEVSRLECLDACSLALVFAALALEARLNRVLRHCDASEWRAVAHLGPAEKFRLAPRLLAELGRAAAGEELGRVVGDVFDVRDELVDAGGSAGSALRFGPSLARAMVEASARACSFLATLTSEGESDTARLVEGAAEALTRRADALALTRSPSRSYRERSLNGDADFPPDLPEW